MSKIYNAEKIYFQYEKDWVLNDISLGIHLGEFLGIIGPNGSGKTSLLKSLAALLRPQKGKISLFDRPLEKWTRKDLARTIGVVPQESFFLYPYSVLEIVLMGRWVHSRPLEFEGPRDYTIAREILSTLGLEEFAGRSIQAVSGGERQRAVIGRALAQEPEILLLDEPTAFLDLSHQLHLYQILHRLNREKKITVITVSHDLNLAAQFCDRLVLMNHGRLVQEGPPDIVITPSLLEMVYGCRTLVDRHPVNGRPRVTLITS